jgi:mannosyltransferase
MTNLAPTRPVADSEWRKHPLTLAMIGLILFGTLARIYRLSTANLWTDEVYSAAMSKESLPHIVGLTIRYDSHPPLYYLYLHFWQLVSDSDLWLALNSTILSFLCGWLLYAIVTRLYDARTALIALALYAVLPLEVVFSETVRMYALEGIAALTLFYLGERIARQIGSFHWNVVAFALLSDALILLHGFGVIVSFFIVLYTLVRCRQTGLPLRSIALFVAAAAIGGLAAVYPAIMGRVRTTVGISNPSIGAITAELTTALLGFDIPRPAITGIVLLGGFIAFILWQRRARSIAVWLFVAPTALMILISILVKPVYTYRGTGLFMPFFAIALALAFTSRTGPDGTIETAPAAHRWALGLLFAILTGAALFNVIDYRKPGFAGSAIYWAEKSAPGDVMFADGFASDYIGFVRYLPHGPRLAFHDVAPPLPDKWRPIYIRLGPRVVRVLGLTPKRNVLDYEGRKILPWLDPSAVAHRTRYWRFGMFDGPSCTVPGFIQTQRHLDQGYIVALCARSKTGT